MIRVLSLGAGVQSTTLLLMSIAGEVDPIDHAIFADTGWEPAAVYEHLDRLTSFAEDNGVKVHRVSNGDLRSAALDATTRGASMPLFVRNLDGSRGMVRRQCTSEYKVKPIERKLRELVGIKARQRPKGVLVEQWKGISFDEWQRMGDASFPWIKARYPLVDLKMTRWDCHRWLAAHDWSAPRSACIGCPFHSDAEWRAIKTRPAEWADAVDFDQRVRGGSARAEADGSVLLGTAFLHSSLKPLDEVNLDTEEDRGQGSLFDTECQGVCGV